MAEAIAKTPKFYADLGWKPNDKVILETIEAKAKQIVAEGRIDHIVDTHSVATPGKGLFVIPNHVHGLSMKDFIKQVLELAMKTGKPDKSDWGNDLEGDGVSVKLTFKFETFDTQTRYMRDCLEEPGTNVAKAKPANALLIVLKCDSQDEPNIIMFAADMYLKSACPCHL